MDEGEVVQVRRRAPEPGVVGGGVDLARAEEGSDVLQPLLVDHALDLHCEALHAPR